jgi:hypothetical protein
MDPEGELPASGARGPRLPPFVLLDPPVEEEEQLAYIPPAAISRDDDSAPILPETNRVKAGRAFLTMEHSHQDIILFCDTPSEDDDESSLSSSSLPLIKKSYAFFERTRSEEDESGIHSEDTIQDEVTLPMSTVHATIWRPSTKRILQPPTFSRYSLFLGFLVGCFIQSSSLGANYVLTVLFGHDFDQMREHHEKVLVFSLVWSLATSSMGVLVVLFLRSLLQAVPNESIQSQMNLWHVEYSFAFGALVGVCMAWTGTDLLLGFHAHAVHSLLTLLFAVVLKTVISCAGMAPEGRQIRQESLTFDDCDDDDTGHDLEALSRDSVDVYYPLMEEKPAEKPIWRTLHTHFKIHGTILGVLIGFFIQMSSLGASFLLDSFASEDESGRVQLTTDGLLVFSLGWSFVFGTMGVTILLILRRLLLLVCSSISTKFAHKLGLMLEFYFAVGCLVGVNLAWVLTDLGLGLQAHVMRSLLTLAAAAIWCRILACCFFSDRSLEDCEEEDEECDDNEELLSAERPVPVTLRRRPVELVEGVLLV